MPAKANKRRIVMVTVVYWFMLAYVMAALVWWFISLEQQNEQMMLLKLSELNSNDIGYEQKLAEVLDYRQRKHGQYVGEGIIFMLLILIVAVFVYRAIRRFLKLNQQQQNFMMAVTHELKTPIAATRLNIETMQRRQLTTAQTQRLLQLTLEENERLNDLCNNILVASRFDSGKAEAYREVHSLSVLVEDGIAECTSRAGQRTITGRVEPSIQVQGDPLLLKLLISNLIDNALKYTPIAKPISVALQKNNTHAILTVADEGPGIPASEKKRVFEKFYRSGNEATRQKKGTGLGLYLAQRIATDHGGTIALTDNQPSGAVFTVTLPLSF
jgi:signal transduction histidine kinase